MRGTRIAAVGLAGLAGLGAASVAGAGMMSVTVDFNDHDVGAAWGPGAEPPSFVGDTVFSESGVTASITDFLDLSQSPATSPTATVEIVENLFGFDTPALEYSGNIALQYDFAGVGFDVGRVELSWRDLGGTKTIGVNGDTLGVGDFEDAPQTLGGAQVTLAENGVDGTDRLIFRGDIDTITIGGQGLTIDDVTAFVPAPGVAGLAIPAAILGLRRRR